MRSFIVEIINDNYEVIVEKWMNETAKYEKTSALNRFVDHDQTETNREFIELVLQSIILDGEDYRPKMVEFSEKVMGLGWHLEYITKGLQLVRHILLELLSEKGFGSHKPLQMMKKVDDLVDPIVNEMVKSYTGAWENTFSLQKDALQELSSPLIPLFDNITVMPLIGTIDTERAQLIMENLLDGAVKHRSEVVLIDITGVPVVDTMVAHHIIQAVEAVRLIGAQAILVGIRPEIAQTIVNLGIDLSQFPTKNTMKKGIESALEITNRKLTSLN
ncbi:STAS domain-containing protein [Bacillus tianshenii]|nr:STAS domain-containing protein [Bacillus tianshenii]